MARKSKAEKAAEKTLEESKLQETSSQDDTVTPESTDTTPITDESQIDGDKVDENASDAPEDSTPESLDEEEDIKTEQLPSMKTDESMDPSEVPDIIKPTTGIALKIKAIDVAFHNGNRKSMAMAVKSFVSTAIASFGTNKGKSILREVRTAYRENKNFDLVELNRLHAEIVNITNLNKANQILTFHTLMTGTCDRNKADAFYATIVKDNIIKNAGLNGVRHLF